MGDRFTIYETYNVSCIVNVNVARTSVSLRVSICDIRSKLIVSVRAVRGTLTFGFNAR